jgi:hypothetical protein
VQSCGQLETLERALPQDGTVILVAWSPWAAKTLLERALKFAVSPTRKIHLVLSESIVQQLPTGGIDALLSRVAGIVSVRETPAEEEQLPGCLEMLPAVMSSPSWAFLKGILSWQGSLHHRKPRACLEELLKDSPFHLPGKRLIAARLQDDLIPELKRELSAHGHADLKIVMGNRPCGARIGVLRRIRQKGLDRE